jgi:glutathione S-transferase
MRYEFYYWPNIQGRGEFVRLALEAARAEYIDVARGDEAKGQGVPALLAIMNGDGIEQPPYAPPFLKAGKRIVAQTSNILLYLGPRLDLAPASGKARQFVHQLQLTMMDLVKDVHDTHHPISSTLYYEEQKDAARLAAAKFIEVRLPKYLGYFEKVLQRNPASGKWLVGTSCTYADLSLFQIVEGLRYAFPNAMAREEANYPRIASLAAKVRTRKSIAAYLASPRRIAFNEMGVFRRYSELDS